MEGSNKGGAVFSSTLVKVGLSPQKSAAALVARSKMALAGGSLTRQLHHGWLVR